MPLYFPVRYSHGGETNRQALSSDTSVHQMDSCIHNHDLTQSTPRSLTKFNHLCFSDIDGQIGWTAASTAPSPSQTAVPREYDPDHAWQQNGVAARVDCDPYRRRSEPQINKLHTRICRETSVRSGYRHSSPLINWRSSDERSSDQHPPESSHAFISPQDTLRKGSKEILFKLQDIADDGRLRLEQLNRKVLLAMETQPWDRRRSSAEISEASQRRDSEQIRHIGCHEYPVRSALATEYIPPDPGKPMYRPLARPGSQIRLFRLSKTAQDGEIKGSFVYTDIETCPKYTALSYAWGEPTKTRKITIDGQNDVEIGENLWWFLHCRGRTIKKSRLFWIDAICIDQSNLDERNHQVGLMKRIYSTASNVYIWLGRETASSRLAMEFLTNEGREALRRQVDDYRPIWGDRQGQAIRDLFQRPYWRRMWVIQEIIHAKTLTVWCGSQRVDWPVLDQLYLTMKTLQEENQLENHPSATEILRSPALVMVWQRAHWRHPETPTPKLQTLVETFQGWECTDIRDKIYALVSMADQKTAVLPNYSRTPEQIYQDVLRQGFACDSRFRRLLAQVLEISPEHQI